jgi:hypothetical protein
MTSTPEELAAAIPRTPFSKSVPIRAQESDDTPAVELKHAMQEALGHDHNPTDPAALAALIPRGNIW